MPGAERRPPADSLLVRPLMTGPQPHANPGADNPRAVDARVEDPGLAHHGPATPGTPSPQGPRPPVIVTMARFRPPRRPAGCRAPARLPAPSRRPERRRQ